MSKGVTEKAPASAPGPGPSLQIPSVIKNMVTHAMKVNPKTGSTLVENGIHVQWSNGITRIAATDRRRCALVLHENPDAEPFQVLIPGEVIRQVRAPAKVEYLNLDVGPVHGGRATSGRIWLDNASWTFESIGGVFPEIQPIVDQAMKLTKPATSICMSALFLKDAGVLAEQFVRRHRLDVPNLFWRHGVEKHPACMNVEGPDTKLFIVVLPRLFTAGEEAQDAA